MLLQGLPLRLGDRGPAVAEIRDKLARLGQDPRLAPRGDVFDTDLDAAVRRFQQERGLTADGVIGAATYRVLEEARWRLGDRLLSYVVSHPLTGDDVLGLQRRLAELGFDVARVDGIFGPLTAGALQDFQRNVGLPADGTCGPSTFKALARLSPRVTGGRPERLRARDRLRAAGPALRGKVVVIDPGHGGADRGACAHGLEEAAVVADLAARVEGRLGATGVQALLTRSVRHGGVGPTLDDAARAAFANATAADLVVSLHCDAAPSPRAQGLATYYYGHGQHGARSAIGERFADLVQRELVARTDLVDCRTHAKTWDLLRDTRMPAVRVEVAFLTSPEDAERLADPGFRDVVAEAVVVAVQRVYLPEDADAQTGRLRLPDLADV